ncbi:unnamed protein product [Effrenium voratum]|nr:unnamed protein product [Effrenium voratum]
MPTVTVVSATTGDELLTIEIGEEWHVGELKAIIFARDGTSPGLQSLLLGGQILSDDQRFNELGGDQIELQLLRGRWTITVRDARKEWSGDYYNPEEAEVWHVESYPDCTDEMFLVQVAEKMGLPPATLPSLIANGWQVSDAGLYDLKSYELQSGSEVKLTRTYPVPLMSVERSPPKSRRSEFLESNAALGLLDECQTATLLHPEDFDVTGEVKVILTAAIRGCGCAAQLPQVLSDDECDQIQRRAKQLAFVPQELSCRQGTRRYNRVVVQDEKLSQLLWSRTRAFLEEALAVESKRPLGFGCAQGEWALAGLNHCFRINSYGPEGFLKPHRDAAFSPNHSLRSFCTLLVPLTSAGRTRFYQPKVPLDFRGMTLAEELSARGGLKGFLPTDAVLSKGCPLVFGQALLHEGLPDQLGAKVVLRTDVMVRRASLPRVLLTPEERRDHMQALRWFREAQQKELRGEPSNDFYERALSYRYFHPNGPPPDSESEICSRKWTAQEAVPLAPNPLLERHLGFAMPELVHLRGPVAAFRLKGAAGDAGGATSTTSTTSTNSTGHLRVAAMYALHLLGHKAYEECGEGLYTVDFDPSTQKVAAVPLPQILQDVFESKPCYGAIYNVASRTGDPLQDFSKAVDRSHLVLQHGALPCASSVDLLAAMKTEGFVDESGGDLRGDGTVESYALPNFNRKVRKAYRCARDCDTPSSSSSDYSEVEPDWSLYLSGLLSEGTPGLDVVSVARGEETYLPEQHEIVCLCGDCSEDPPNEKVIPSMKPLNHLVFDFGKHELLVEAHSSVEPSESGGLHDLHLLWAELLRQHELLRPQTMTPMTLTLPLEEGDLTLFKDSACTVAALDSKGELQTVPLESFQSPGAALEKLLPNGQEVCASPALQEFISGSAAEFFPWYTISLHGLNASFHHAGEMNGCQQSVVLDVQVEHAGLAESEHTTTVLAAVTSDGDDTLIWTIYHGLSAL